MDVVFQRIGGYRKCRHERPLRVYPVIDKFVYAKFENNLTITRTITYRDVAFQRFGGTECQIITISKIAIQLYTFKIGFILLGYKRNVCPRNLTLIA